MRDLRAGSLANTMGALGIWYSTLHVTPTVTASEAHTSTSSSVGEGGESGVPSLPPPVIHSAPTSGYLICSGTTTSTECVHTWPMSVRKSSGCSHLCEVTLSR